MTGLERRIQETTTFAQFCKVRLQSGSIVCCISNGWVGCKKRIQPWELQCWSARKDNKCKRKQDEMQCMHRDSCWMLWSTLLFVVAPPAKRVCLLEELLNWKCKDHPEVPCTSFISEFCIEVIFLIWDIANGCQEKGRGESTKSCTRQTQQQSNNWNRWLAKCWKIYTLQHSHKIEVWTVFLKHAALLHTVVSVQQSEVATSFKTLRQSGVFTVIIWLQL